MAQPVKTVSATVDGSTFWRACGDGTGASAPIPKSPRAGLLTFEHMGCPKYEWDGREDYLETASGRKAMKRCEEPEEELQSWTKTKHNPMG